MRPRLVGAATGVLLGVAGVGIASGRVGPTRASPAAQPAIDGAGLFVAKGCASCHDGPDSNATVEVAPSLVDAAAWAAERRPGMDAAMYLAESITDPSVFISPASASGWAMPLLAVSGDEVDLLVDHLLAG